MKKIMLLFLCLFMMSSYAVSSNCAEQDICTVNVAQLTAALNNKDSINLSKKTPSISIHLTSNPTTGYSWTVAKYDKNLVSVTKKDYVRSSHMMGAGGYEVWEIKAKHTGFAIPKKTKVDMIYIRSWEKHQPPAKQKSFSVTIN